MCDVNLRSGFVWLFQGILWWKNKTFSGKKIVISSILKVINKVENVILNIARYYFTTFCKFKNRIIKGSSTFIPYIEATSVGTDITIVMTAKVFITMFKLFEMIVPNASIIPVRISL